MSLVETIRPRPHLQRPPRFAVPITEGTHDRLPVQGTRGRSRRLVLRHTATSVTDRPSVLAAVNKLPPIAGESALGRRESTQLSLTRRPFRPCGRQSQSGVRPEQRAIPHRSTAYRGYSRAATVANECGRSNHPLGGPDAGALSRGTRPAGTRTRPAGASGQQDGDAGAVGSVRARPTRGLNRCRLRAAQSAGGNAVRRVVGGWAAAGVHPTEARGEAVVSGPNRGMPAHQKCDERTVRRSSLRRPRWDSTPTPANTRRMFDQ